MSILCLTTEIKHQRNLYRLWYNYSFNDFQLLNETNSGKSLIDTGTIELYKKSKQENTPELLHFASKERLDSLLELALLRDRMWPIGKRITVKFLHNNPVLESKIISFAHEWSTYGNIYFDFVNSGNAEIRISLHPDGSNWSKIGTYALEDKTPNSPTMHLGGLTTTSTDELIRRTTLHEFGHALGCVHEHQTIQCPIKWKKDVVYRVYSMYGWSTDMVDNNVFNIYTSSELSNSPTFDKDSIMIYPIPSIFTQDGTEINLNSDLSTLDKRFIGEQYPKI
jgi:hypothetical protein